jgi:uncharacterized repeat protein (TIGR03803 family)
VFKVDSTGHETVLYNFDSCSSNCTTDGFKPLGGLIRDTKGDLYGTTWAGGAGGPPALGTVFELDSTGHETVLYSFASYSSDGFSPGAGLIRDATGNLYGTTIDGGAYANNMDKGGTVFKVDSTGHETLLHSFCSATNCPDGEYPMAGLIQDTKGNS